jgi:hypothetical protein
MINCLHFTTGKTGCPPQLKFSLINIDAEGILEILHSGGVYKPSSGFFSGYDESTGYVVTQSPQPMQRSA